MSCGNLQTLTLEERRTAQENHDTIIHGFLRRHGFNFDDYYTTAVIGYLKGVQAYHRNPAAKKWALSTICEKDMMREILNENRDNKRQKRMPSGGFISLDNAFEDYNESYINSILSPTLEDEYFLKYEDYIPPERLKEILSPLSDFQRQVVIFLASDFDRDYIMKKLKLTPKEFSKVLYGIRRIKPGTRTHKNTTTDNNRLTDYIGFEYSKIYNLKLSPLQVKVFGLLAMGNTESEIARQLNTTRQNIYSAISRVRKKVAVQGG